MSRIDASAALQALGFLVDIDFIAIAQSPTSTLIQWLSGEAQPSESTLNAVTPGQVAAAVMTKNHTALTTLVATRDRPTQLLVALLAVILAEFNLHALKTNAILDAVDGAATLANLKTAVAAIADYPQRTKAQLITALNNAINAGDGDS